MSENTKKFLEKVSGDEELRNAFTACKNADEIVSLAKEYGFDLSKEDFQAAIPTEGKQALGKDELDAVVGGSKCGCAIGGGGKASGSDEEVCACVVSGIGFINTDDYCLPRCACVAGGAGFDNPI